MSDDQAFSIGDVSDATGLSAETLRIWERRYGRPRPERLPSGHRRFTGGQVRWLRRVAEALARGHRPGEVVPLGERELDRLLEPGKETVVEAEARALLDLAHRFDRRGLLDRLRRRWDPDRYLAFLSDDLGVFLRVLGRAWADGEIDVRHEHFVSEVVEDLIRSLRMGHPPCDGPPRVLLTTLAGETHGLGLQMCALVCAARQVACRVLGVDLPSVEIVRAVSDLRPSALAVSVSLATGGIETDRALADLRRELPDDVKLLVGGEGARGVRRGPRGVVYLEDLAAFDAAIAAI
jgi:DNA-binding transcriptional MerR regulator